MTVTTHIQRHPLVELVFAAERVRDSLLSTRLPKANEGTVIASRDSEKQETKIALGRDEVVTLLVQRSQHRYQDFSMTLSQALDVLSAIPAASSPVYHGPVDLTPVTLEDVIGAIRSALIADGTACRGHVQRSSEGEILLLVTREGNGSVFELRIVLPLPQSGPH